jgi:hypothetical protein
VPIALVVLATTGCQLSKSKFAKEAEKAGSEFAAAATTLEYLHTGKLTWAYSKAAFVSYRQVIAGLDDRLRTAEGKPSPSSIQSLLSVAGPAEDALAHPCLDAACDWAGQIAALRAASDTLLTAADES